MNAAADWQGIRSAYVRKVVVVERAQIHSGALLMIDFEWSIRICILN